MQYAVTVKADSADELTKKINSYIKSGYTIQIIVPFKDNQYVLLCQSNLKT